MENLPHEMLNLIPKIAEEKKQKQKKKKKLELGLGPPGAEDQLPLHHLLLSPTHHHGAKRGFQATIDDDETRTGERNWLMDKAEGPKPKKLCFQDEQKLGSCQYPWAFRPFSKFPSPSSSSSAAASYQGQSQKQPSSSSLHLLSTLISTPNYSAAKAEESIHKPPPVSYSSQKRNNTLLTPAAVGWPPIGSYRKSVASNSGSSSMEKHSPESSNKSENNNSSTDECLFVKVNMDGVPIGRKLDLKAYDNYQILSSAVNQLFTGLLKAQRGGSWGALTENGIEETNKGIIGGGGGGGSLDGSGVYTLVYEDNEGDRILVGDVPWHMFVSSAKRLRVLKKSELPPLNLSSSKLGKKPDDSDRETVTEVHGMLRMSTGTGGVSN